MTDKMEVIEIAINKIRPAAYQPRQHFEKEAIEELGESIKANGLIQPITVRKDKKGENYEIIAGERRWRAATLIGMKTIKTIVKDVDDFSAKEISIVENYQREDLNDIEREKYIYDLYIDGIKSKRYSISGPADKGYTDMSRKTGINATKLRTLIKAYEDRNSLKNSRSLELTPSKINNLNTDDFSVTRVLDQSSPEARKELLAIRADERAGDIMPQREMRKVVQQIKQVDAKDQAAVAKLVREEKVEPKNLEKFVKVLRESAPEVQEKLLKAEVTPDEAEYVKTFETPEQRKQMLQERRIIIGNTSKEDEAERHKAVRMEQAEDIKAGKQPKIPSVRFDLQNPKDESVKTERTIRRYQDALLAVLAYTPDNVLSFKDKDTQDQLIDIIKRTESHCTQVLMKIQEFRPLLLGKKAGVIKLETGM